MALARLVMSLVTAIVTLFVGIFMISRVSTVASINNTSAFYTIYTSLITQTATLYDVMNLVIVIVALAVAINTLKGMSGGGAPSTVSSV